MKEAIILAGGLGTRLKSVIGDIPKPMAQVARKPFLEILIKLLFEKKFTHIILSVGYSADKITDYFGREFCGVPIVYSKEEKPLGTGGAIRLALDEATQEHVYVFNGDTYLDFQADELEKLWQKDNLPIIVGREVEDTSRYGRLLVENGKVKGFAEKGVSGRGLINAGCYILQKNQLDDFPLNQSFSFENDYLVKAVNEKDFNVFTTAGKFIDIGIPKDYERAQIELA